MNQPSILARRMNILLQELMNWPSNLARKMPWSVLQRSRVREPLKFFSEKHNILEGHQRPNQILRQCFYDQLSILARRIKCCAKGFFSEISILDKKWLLKIAKKKEKMHFSLHWAGIGKTFIIQTPIIFFFRGGHTSSILSKSCSFLRYAFLELEFIIQNNDF